MRKLSPYLNLDDIAEAINAGEYPVKSRQGSEFFAGTGQNMTVETYWHNQAASCAENPSAVEHAARHRTAATIPTPTTNNSNRTGRTRSRSVSRSNSSVSRSRAEIGTLGESRFGDSSRGSIMSKTKVEKRDSSMSRSRGLSKALSVSRSRGERREASTSRSRGLSEDTSVSRSRGAKRYSSVSRSGGASKDSSVSRSRSVRRDTSVSRSRGSSKDSSVSRSRGGGRDSYVSRSRGVGKGSSVSRSRTARRDSLASRSRGLSKDSSLSRSRVGVRDSSVSRSRGVSKGSSLSRSRSARRDSSASRSRGLSKDSSLSRARGEERDFSVSRSRGVSKASSLSRSSGERRDSSLSRSRAEEKGSSVTRLRDGSRTSSVSRARSRSRSLEKSKRSHSIQSRKGGPQIHPQFIGPQLGQCKDINTPMEKDDSDISATSDQQQIKHIQWLAHGWRWTLFACAVSWTGSGLAFLSRQSLEFVTLRRPWQIAPIYEEVSSLGVVHANICYNETLSMINYPEKVGCFDIPLATNKDIDDPIFGVAASFASLATLFGSVLTIFLSTSVCWRTINFKAVGTGYLFVYCSQSLSFLFFDTDLCGIHECQVGAGCIYAIAASIFWITACLTCAKMDANRTRTELKEEKTRRKRAAAKKAMNKQQSNVTVSTGTVVTERTERTLSTYSEDVFYDEINMDLDEELAVPNRHASSIAKPSAPEFDASSLGRETTSVCCTDQNTNSSIRRHSYSGNRTHSFSGTRTGLENIKYPSRNAYIVKNPGTLASSGGGQPVTPTKTRGRSRSTSRSGREATEAAASTRRASRSALRMQSKSNSRRSESRTRSKTTSSRVEYPSDSRTTTREQMEAFQQPESYLAAYCRRETSGDVGTHASASLSPPPNSSRLKFVTSYFDI
jgi:hypothetical protein